MAAAKPPRLTQRRLAGLDYALGHLMTLYTDMRHEKDAWPADQVRDLSAGIDYIQELLSWAKTRESSNPAPKP